MSSIRPPQAPGNLPGTSPAKGESLAATLARAQGDAARESGAARTAGAPPPGGREQSVFRPKRTQEFEELKVRTHRELLEKLDLVALASLSREHVQDSELMMAGSVVTIAPVLALFLGLQRYYMQGLLAGSVK